MCDSLENRLCRCTGRTLGGIISMGLATTATTAGLHYTGTIDDPKLIIIPSIVTMLSIGACILRSCYYCRVNRLTNKSSQTVIIHNHGVPVEMQTMNPVDATPATGDAIPVANVADKIV